MNQNLDDMLEHIIQMQQYCSQSTSHEVRFHELLTLLYNTRNEIERQLTLTKG